MRKTGRWYRRNGKIEDGNSSPCPRTGNFRVRWRLKDPDITQNFRRRDVFERQLALGSNFCLKGSSGGGSNSSSCCRSGCVILCFFTTSFTSGRFPFGGGRGRGRDGWFNRWSRDLLLMHEWL